MHWWDVILTVGGLAMVATYFWDRWQKKRYEKSKKEQGPAESQPAEEHPPARPEGPAGDLVKRWRQWRDERLPRGERVFLAELGRWPRVRKIREGCYVLTGHHYSPSGQKEAGQLAIALVILAALWLMDLLNRKPAPAWLERYGWVLILLGLFVIFSGRIIRSFEPWILSSPARIRFDRGDIEWKGHNKHWWQFGLGPSRKEKVFATESGQVEVIRPHRKAAEEARRALELQRQNKKTPRLYYQDATEVVIGVGARMAQKLTIAEFSFDPNADKAGRLAAAILTTQDAARADAARRPSPETDRMFG
jgi:hypothetical protein